MNSLDALANAAKEDAGIARAPSWPTEADLAAGHLVGLLADYEPTPVPPMFQPSQLAWPKIEGLGRQSRRALRGIGSLGAQCRGTINRISIQFLNRARWSWYTKLLINRVS